MFVDALVDHLLAQLMSGSLFLQLGAGVDLVEAHLGQILHLKLENSAVNIIEIICLRHY